MGFSRQEYWSGLPFFSPEDLPDTGIEPGLLHCRQILYRKNYRKVLSSSAIHLYFWLLSFPASGFFPVSQLFASCGQSIRASASASVLPMYIQGWFPLRLTSLISLKIKESSPESSPELPFESIDSSVPSLLCGPPLTSIHDYWKNHSFEYTDLWRQRDVSAF